MENWNFNSSADFSFCTLAPILSLHLTLIAVDFRLFPQVLLEDYGYEADQGMLHDENDKTAASLLEVDENGRKKLSTGVYNLLLEGPERASLSRYNSVSPQNHPQPYAGVQGPGHHELNLAIAMSVAMILGHQDEEALGIHRCDLIIGSSMFLVRI